MATTWAGTSNNQLVTFTALNDARGTILVPINKDGSFTLYGRLYA